MKKDTKKLIVNINQIDILGYNLVKINPNGVNNTIFNIISHILTPFIPVRIALYVQKGTNCTLSKYR
jgi:hypothetical protein